MGFGGNLVQGFRVYAWRAVPSFPQIALWVPSLALWPQPFWSWKNSPTRAKNEVSALADKIRQMVFESLAELVRLFWARYPSFKTTLDDWSDQGSPMLHPFDLLAPSDFALWLNTRRARWRYDSAEMCEYHARVNTRILFRCLRCVNTVFGSHGHSYESHGGANWRPPTPAGPRA